MYIIAVHWSEGTTWSGVRVARDALRASELAFRPTKMLCGMWTLESNPGKALPIAHDAVLAFERLFDQGSWVLKRIRDCDEDGEFVPWANRGQTGLTANFRQTAP